jgi:hypothetical protein
MRICGDPNTPALSTTSWLARTTSLPFAVTISTPVARPDSMTTRDTVAPMTISRCPGRVSPR